MVDSLPLWSPGGGVGINECSDGHESVCFGQVFGVVDDQVFRADRSVHDLDDFSRRCREVLAGGWLSGARAHWLS